MRSMEALIALTGGSQYPTMNYTGPEIMNYLEAKIMDQYPKRESIGSRGSIILAVLEVQVHRPPKCQHRGLMSQILGQGIVCALGRGMLSNASHNYRIPSPPRTYYLGTGAFKGPLRAYCLGTWGPRESSLNPLGHMGPIRGPMGPIGFK